MRKAPLTWLVLSIATAGCAITEPSGPHPEAQARLTQALRLWRSQALVDYSYVLSRGCFCVLEYREPATITVRGGNIVSAVSVASGAPRDPAFYETIEDLFASIQGAIDEDAAVLDAEYDRVRGYPVSVYIDLDRRLADEEISYEARSLTAIR